jgi:cytochrome c biogenesis protein CcdA
MRKERGVRTGFRKRTACLIAIGAVSAIVLHGGEPTPPPVVIDYFYEPGCPACLRIEREIIPELQRRYEGFYELNHHDMRSISNVVRLIRYHEALGVADNSPVSMFVDYAQPLFGLDAIRDGLLACVDACIADRLDPEWRPSAPIAWEPFGSTAVAHERVGKFTLPAVLVAGLIDGLNPCAIATLVLFISLLTVSGGRRRTLLLMGVPFCVAAFLTYTAIGFGLLSGLHALSAFPRLRIFFETGVAVGLLFLAVFSFRDAWRYARSHDAHDVAVKLPDWAQRANRAIMRRGVGGHHLVMGGLVVGIVVTAIETVCTGQVYVPALTLVAHEGGGGNAWSLLLAYNAMFILPLVGALVLTRYGLTTETMLRWSRKNVPFAKTLLGLFFVAVAVYLLV